MVGELHNMTNCTEGLATALGRWSTSDKEDLTYANILPPISQPSNCPYPELSTSQLYTLYTAPTCSPLTSFENIVNM